MARLCCVAAFAALWFLCWQPVSAQDAPAKPAVEDPRYALFAVAGRTWTLKRVPYPGNEGGDIDTTYHRYEVTAVHADHAEFGQCSLASPNAEAADLLVVKVRFKPDENTFKDPIGFVKSKQEKLKTPAGTFDCIKFVSPENAAIWRSVDYPGLMVKSDDRFGMRELVAFDFIDGDPVQPEGKAKPKKPKPVKADDDEKRLFKKKGRKWLVKTSTFSGPADKRARRFDMRQFEVTAVKPDEATVESLRLTLLKEKIKGETPEVLTIRFDDFAAQLKPAEASREDRVERRKVTGGVFTCRVYTFTDKDGREGTAWYANEWPGLCVRRHVKGQDFEQISELIEFTE
ncbi:MAG: hypothetical protein HS108_06570 [Planctomycetes bacterium]|jgi:hypothetical protein|nr:hypothetical protein [Planctomycetota bacterium]MCL4731536.1 hypothetical protein [Planctomycetota bacterium]